MASRGKHPLSVVVTMTLPLVLLGNTLILLLIPWFADFQYALPGFPVDPYGLAGDARAELARTGIRSIWPVGPGPELLVDARLPDGSAAFRVSEERHMEDVRDLVRGSLIVWLTALLALVASLLRLHASGRQTDADTGLKMGAALTIGLLSLVGLAMLVAFDPVFEGFHQVFFEPGTWAFPDDYTLRRLYPDAFWAIASTALALGAIAQAIGVWVLTRRGLRLASRRRDDP